MNGLEHLGVMRQNLRPCVIRTRTAKKGMSLLEMLIVVTIIAILSLVLVPNIRNHFDRTKTSKTRTLLETLTNAIDTYRNDTGKYPPSGSDFLQEALTKGLGDDPKDTDPHHNTKDPKWRGPYISLDPKDLLSPEELAQKMPRFASGGELISPSARSTSGYKFIKDSWGYPLLYVTSDAMLSAAISGSGAGMEQTKQGEIGPYYPAWKIEIPESSMPAKREDVGNFCNFVNRGGRTGKAFQLYSVGQDGITRSDNGGPGTLCVHDEKDNDSDGLIDENDNANSTRKSGTLPEDDVNNW